MKVAPMGEVKNNFGRYLIASETEPVFVTKNGKITAVIKHIESGEIEDFLLEHSARFRQMLDRVKKEKGETPLAAYRKSRNI